MARPQSNLLTEKETAIMDSLWNRGEVTAEVIRQDLPGQPHDSSVRTLLRILVQKGYVEVVPDTRPTVYKAVLKKMSFQKKATLDLLKRVFDGSAQDLVLHLLNDSQISAEQLKELEKKYRRHSKKESST